MKFGLLAAIAASCISLVAHAASPVALKLLDSESMGDATAPEFMNRSVRVKPTRYGKLAFETADAKLLRFACESGDAALVKPAKGAAVAEFEGVTASAQGWDGLTVWRLKDCRFVTGKAAATS